MVKSQKHHKNLSFNILLKKPFKIGKIAVPAAAGSLDQLKAQNCDSSTSGISSPVFNLSPHKQAYSPHK